MDSTRLLTLGNYPSWKNTASENLRTKSKRLIWFLNQYWIFSTEKSSIFKPWIDSAGELSPLLAINNLIRESSKKYSHHHPLLPNDEKKNPQNLHLTSKPDGGIRHPVNTKTSKNHHENEIPLLPAKSKMAHLQQVIFIYFHYNTLVHFLVG